MISRIWHGWTTLENADAYETLLREEIFHIIKNKQITGYRGIQLLRRPLGEEVEFITVMRLDNLEAVREFAGEDYETAFVLPQARRLLKRFDDRSQHYDIRVAMEV
jgi:antibiotic biosynthesis monooxygenase (ABM) superfamily enzyme